MDFDQLGTDLSVSNTCVGQSLVMVEGNMQLALPISRNSLGAVQAFEKHVLEEEEDLQLALLARPSQHNLGVGQICEENSPKDQQMLQLVETVSEDGTSTYISQGSILRIFPELIECTASPSRASQTPTLSTLPIEILAVVVPYLDRADAVAFGLTHQNFYNALKEYQPHMLSSCLTSQQRDMAPEEPPYDWLAVFVLEEASTQRVLTMIGDFLGPQYRPTRDHRINTPYLNRLIYGDYYGYNEESLGQRWAAYTLGENGFLSPFGVGEAWYAGDYSILQ